GRAPGMAGPGAAEAAPRLVSPPVETIAATDPEGSLASAEKAALLRELERHRWNMTNTARDLGLSRNTLYRKLKKHGITPPTLS
ncbi:MAG TPA: helix-turn-helix domain-containing protein, partial [Plasticicumulans sp.]|nr:helix-turn-helix domain-containing protein [Plasticicumulans sp.]